MPTTTEPTADGEGEYDIGVCCTSIRRYGDLPLLVSSSFWLPSPAGHLVVDLGSEVRRCSPPIVGEWIKRDSGSSLYIHAAQASFPVPRSILMKACHCLTHSCKGKSVDARIFKQHRDADRATLAALAQEKSEEAIAEQHRTIADYVASQTALGSTTGRSNRGLEDPFSFQRLSDTLPDLHPAPPQPPSNRKQALQMITSLGALDDKVEAHLRKVKASIFEPVGRHPTLDPFPLRSLLNEAYQLKDQLDLVKLKAPAVVELRGKILGKVEKSIVYLKEKELIWENQSRRTQDEVVRLSEGHLSYNSDHHFRTTLETVNPALQIFFFAVVALSVLFSLPRRACSFLLQAYRYSLHLAFSYDATLSQKDQNILANIPEDPRSILQEFHLEGKHVIRAVCPDPKCHAQYNPTFNDDSPVPAYPRHCSHRAYPGGGKCRQPLLRPKSFQGTSISVPIKTFVAFSLKDWVSNVLSRRGVEDSLDESWTEALRWTDGDLEDVFHGSILRDFRGPDNKLFGVHGEEGHYVFSLCVDFFNPLGNKQAGKKSSIGIISLVCLNLPPEERYKPENIFLAGIIPGPAEPPLDSLNHYLSPVIDELLEFWEPGVFISRTHRHPLGRLIRCALVAVVCDLPAARKTAGFAAVRHDFFCSICKCRQHQDGYVGTPYRNWERRYNSECRKHADNYKNATDEASRLEAFNAHGVRWSELLRLPYFDPARFVVVDAMHNLFLGLIQEHCRNILGIHFSCAPVEKVLNIPLDGTWESFPSIEQTAVLYLRSQLESPFDDDREGYIKRFERRHIKALRYVVGSLGLVVASKRKSPTKFELATALVDWRLQQLPAEPTVFSSSLAAGHILSKSDIDAIRADITAMATPSWTTSIPADLGSPAHGKLKADQWRLLGTVYLPASLILRWGELRDDDPKSRVRRRLLGVTMSLLSAISIATAHNTSSERAALYLNHLQQYIDGVKELFPKYRFRPNHHMAFHIHEYLLMYGPVHSWWCFPFERMIGMLQRIPNNGKPSEYEETIALAFTRSSNLRGMLQKFHCPESLRNFQPFIERLLDTSAKEGIRPSVFPDLEDVQNQDDPGPFTVASAWTGKTLRLPEDVLSGLKEHNPLGPRMSHGVLSSYINIRGFTVSTRSRHAGNSQVMVSSSDEGNPRPSIVRRIFQVEAPQKEVLTYLLVEELPAARIVRDPLIGYPCLGMGMYEQSGTLRIVEPSAVQCHFAALDAAWEGQNLRLVTSLSRV